MSFWFSYRDRDGRQKRVSVGMPDPMTLLMIIVFVVMLLLLPLLPLLQWLRQLFR